jgi:excisionase family DNA binding protein
VAVQREYLSPNEIAELLGVSPFTIRRYIKLGELRAVKLLGGFRIHQDELKRFLKAHEVNSAEEELLPEEDTTVKVDPAPIQAMTTPPAAVTAPGPKPAANSAPARPKRGPRSAPSKKAAPSRRNSHKPG